jgi:hypothetical protein
MSRQTEWQQKKLAQGLCTICGKRPLRTKNHCNVCAPRPRIKAAVTRKLRAAGQEAAKTKKRRAAGRKASHQAASE